MTDKHQVIITLGTDDRGCTTVRTSHGNRDTHVSRLPLETVRRIIEAAVLATVNAQPTDDYDNGYDVICNVTLRSAGHR